MKIWSDVNVKPEMKAHELVEAIKKMEEHKGLKEFIINEIVEDLEFNRKSNNVVENILDKVKEFFNESRWTRMMKLASDFKDFTRTPNEDNKEYVLRFSKLETQLRNENVKLPNAFLTGILLKESKFEQSKKENLMATLDMDNDETVLKEMKKKIRDFRAVEAKSDNEPKETLFLDRGRSRGKSHSPWNNKRKGRSMSQSESENRYRKENSRRRSWRDRHPSYRSPSQSRERRERKGHLHVRNFFLTPRKAFLNRKWRT